MRFCTTCGRNFETSIDICPHDGTPLFGMAGEEENTAQDELVAEVASVLAGDEREPVGVDLFSDDDPGEPEALPEEDEAAQEEEDLFGAPLIDPPPEVDPGVGLDDDLDPFGIAAQAAESVVDEPSEDLFAVEASAEKESSEAEEDFFAESAGLEEADLFSEPEESPGFAQEESDVSQQIAASIDGLLDEIDEDEGERPLSMSSSLNDEESVESASYEDEYVAKKGSKMPLLIILILILGSAAGVYFFMNGSISKGVAPEPNTPAVVAPTPPVQPAEEAVVEESAAVEEAVVEEPEAAAEEAVVEEPAAVEEAVVEEPAAVEKPVVVKEKPAAKEPAKPVAAKPAAVKPAPAKPAEVKPAPAKQEVREPTAEELLELELKRMAP